jgi:hypothetical protein
MHTILPTLAPVAYQLTPSSSFQYYTLTRIGLDPKYVARKLDIQSRVRKHKLNLNGRSVRVSIITKIVQHAMTSTQSTQTAAKMSRSWEKHLAAGLGANETFDATFKEWVDTWPPKLLGSHTFEQHLPSEPTRRAKMSTVKHAETATADEATLTVSIRLEAVASCRQ